MSDEDKLVASDAPRLPLDPRGLTPARVALDRTGVSLVTRHSLEFALAHAQARDAVRSALAVPSLLSLLHDRGLEAIAVKSAARDRTEYLRRPDLGRKLAPASAARLAEVGVMPVNAAARIGFILADGLSAVAVERHAVPLLDALCLLLGLGASGPSPDWALAPIIIAEQARVAVGDEIGVALAADVTVMLIGERPGLSSPASLGAYITWAPRPGRTNAERNCVSNIHEEGLHYEAAAARIALILSEARRLQRTGVELREEFASGTHHPTQSYAKSYHFLKKID
jgi:ethanolamine ammonia-lyase small subunit